MFVSMGTEAFADRARRELLATGETVRKRTVETRGDLTAQEAQIARLARDGLSNPEIGTRLFISPRTVQYHLHKVFIKLGIRSRAQLDRVLPSDATTVPRSSRGGPGRRAARPTTGHPHCALADASAAPRERHSPHEKRDPQWLDRNHRSGPPRSGVRSHSTAGRP